MTARNIRQLVDRLSLLENNDEETGMYTSGKIEVSFSFIADLPPMHFDRFRRSFTGSIKHLCQQQGVSFEEVAPVVEDFLDQAEFYHGYAVDIKKYLKTNKIVLTPEESQRRRLIYSDPTYSLCKTREDVYGIIDTSCRGVVLDRWRQELNFALSVFKARGINL